MTASQAELKSQLDRVNARLAEIQAILDKSTRGTPQTRSLTAEKNKLEAEKRKLETQLGDITTTSSYSSPNPTPVNNSTPSQDQLRKDLAAINSQIANLEKALIGPPKPNDPTAIQRGLNRLNQEKKEIEIKLKNITTTNPTVTDTGDEMQRLLARYPAPNPTNTGLQGSTVNTRKQESVQQNFNVEVNNDWRVRLYLAPNSNYLYKDENNSILSPLRNSNGVIFPYTPTINVTYSANYDPQDVMHSNYKLYFYKNSSVDNISIVCDFTAQDTNEANYLLAVIHFFKSVTKMFYGKDQNPTNGTPPPLVYIDGFGTYQFNKHPLLITNFTYALPNDVDYIRATTNPTVPSGVSKESENKALEGISVTEARLNGITPGGNNPPARWTRQQSGVPTYVPTKMSITLNAIPVISRKDISDNFSLQGYANGSLLLGRDNKNIGAGIW